MSVEHLRNVLEALRMAPFPLMGCPRRNRWKGGWRSDVGAGVMAWMGYRSAVSWPGGLVDVYLTHVDNSPMIWRAGPWRDWWLEDAMILGGMISAQTSLPISRVYVLHEVDGQTLVRYVEIPVQEAEQKYRDLVGAWIEGGDDLPPRIHRRSERARRICFKCPVRQRCEAVDREAGNTEDWE